MSDRQSQFRQDVFAYRKLSHCIYILSLKTGLQIINAVRVAENTPAFLDVLNRFFHSGERMFNLSEIGVTDPIGTIRSDVLYDFCSNYVAAINESGLCYDAGHEHYLWEFIWEMVRNYEFPSMPSRMESVFLFKDAEVASNFLRDCRDFRYKAVSVDIDDGPTQEFDMNWFTDVPYDIPISEAQDYARKYWRQELTEHPVIEILHSGMYSWTEK
jgi:hypothetical protein